MASDWSYEVLVYNRAVRARVEEGLHRAPHSLPNSRDGVGRSELREKHS